VLPDKLIEMGAHVDVAPVYKTSLPNEQDTEVIVSRLRERSVDAVTFTSSSTVNHFVELLGDAPVADLLEGVLIASIGPITSHTIRSHGLEPQVEAQEYTIDGLLAALEAQFAAAGA
jgi:uroporphyrinogen III methyltransferase/synthase